MFLIYFGLFLIVVGVVFHFATRKYLNPYKLYMVFGKKGSGKSTLMTRLALDHLGKGWRVYCTEPINVPGVRLFDVSDIGKLVMVSLDECHGFYYTGHVVEEIS